MKKLVGLGLLVLLGISLVGCSGGNDTGVVENTKSESIESTEQYYSVSEISGSYIEVDSKRLELDEKEAEYYKSLGELDRQKYVLKNIGDINTFRSEDKEGTSKLNLEIGESGALYRYLSITIGDTEIINDEKNNQIKEDVETIKDVPIFVTSGFLGNMSYNEYFLVKEDKLYLFSSLGNVHIYSTFERKVE